MPISGVKYDDGSGWLRVARATPGCHQPRRCQTRSPGFSGRLAGDIFCREAHAAREPDRGDCRQNRNVSWGQLALFFGCLVELICTRSPNRRLHSDATISRELGPCDVGFSGIAYLKGECRKALRVGDSRFRRASGDPYVAGGFSEL